MPPPEDARSWRVLLAWLGEAGVKVGRGAVQVATVPGHTVAFPGDWIVLSNRGYYHVARHFEAPANAA